jgi:hypothetical protein
MGAGLHMHYLTTTIKGYWSLGDILAFTVVSAKLAL